MAETIKTDVAIVGGGIVGLVLAAGLSKRGVNVRLFEQAQNFREVGTGIGFTRNTVKCMEKIHPDVAQALMDGGAVPMSPEEGDPNTYFRWVDGFTQPREDDPTFQQPLLTLNSGVDGWKIVRRDGFLEALVKTISPEVVSLRKRLVSIEDDASSDKVYLSFMDGTKVEANAGTFLKLGFYFLK